MLLRILIVLALGIFIYLGVAKIWRDWTRQFKTDDEQARRLRRERDQREREKPGIIDLKRDEDGRFRPEDDDKR